jgi:hypothetical protein
MATAGPIHRRELDRGGIRSCLLGQLSGPDQAGLQGKPPLAMRAASLRGGGAWPG